MSNKVPQIRFNGYSDAWEERKLGKVFDTITDYVANGSFESLRKNVNSSDINGFAYLVRLQDASNNWQGPWLYTDQHGYEFLKKSKLQPDDIIMANVGSVGKFFLVPKLDKPMTLAPNAVLIKSSENDQGFLYQMMLTPEMQYKIFEKTTPGAQSKINKTDFKMIETRLPNIEEQQKIGSFFKQLDETIALHQRKLDLLKEQKKGYLQKMFPKNGAKVPELRFAGFADDWEERKVSEITDFHKQGFYTKESYNENKKYYLLRGTDMTSNKLILKDTPKINASEKDYEDFKVLKDDFLIVRSGTVGTYAIVKSDITAIFGSYLINFRFNQSIVLNEFFGLFYQSSLFKSQLNKIIQKSSNVNINAENIKSTNIKFPTIEEQQKIGDYFSNLDEIISLHQRKLDLLKEQKKGFLQKMFV